MSCRASDVACCSLEKFVGLLLGVAGLRLLPPMMMMVGVVLLKPLVVANDARDSLYLFGFLDVFFSHLNVYQQGIRFTNHGFALLTNVCYSAWYTRGKRA